MRVAPAIELTSVARLELEKLSRRRTTPVRVAQRSRIILLAADGMQDKQIAQRMGVAPRMAALWRSRFIEHGVEGLMKDAPRPGRTASTPPIPAGASPPPSGPPSRRWTVCGAPR